MIRKLLIFFTMIASTIAFSESKINANLDKEQEYRLPSDQRYKDMADKKEEKNNYFPEKHYTVINIRLYNLKWFNSSNKNREMFNEYYEISAGGSLDLISYDPNTGRYRYKLSITPRKVFNDKDKFVPMALDKYVVFRSNNKPFIYVDGIANVHHDKLNIVNIHHNYDDSSFKLKVEEEEDGNTIILSPLNDIPVSIFVKEEVT